MTCDIKKTIQIFNERKKKKNYSQVSVILFCWSLAESVYNTFNCPPLSFLWCKFFLKWAV